VVGWVVKQEWQAEQQICGGAQSSVLLAKHWFPTQFAMLQEQNIGWLRQN
jgi:hypothetical protein